MIKRIAGKKATAGRTGMASPGVFTKERVNQLMQKRVERSHQAFFSRYGVKDLMELDDLFSRAKSVDDLKSQIEELTKGRSDLQTQSDELATQNRDLTKRLAFTSRNIKPELYADIETYFKGKGLDITEETLNEVLKTHADWVAPSNSVSPLGAEQHGSTGTEEKDLASKIFGVDF